MKKLLALLLIPALILPLLSCGASLPAETDPAETLICRTGETETGKAEGVHDATGFCAGFGRADITPRESVPLAGYGATSYRMSRNVLDPLYATCFALRDEAGETLLIYEMDLCGVPVSFAEQARKMIERSLQIPADHVLLTATHTHSGPDVSSTEGVIAAWKTEAYKAVIQAAEDALADLDRCAVFVGSAKTESLNFVRRYYMENGFTTPNGTYGYGEITAHESEVDPEMRVVRFDRANQPDLVLANWQCHATMTGGSSKYDISSDFIGQFRKFAERDLGVKLLYLQGGAGNVNSFSRLPGEETRGTDYMEKGRQLAAALRGVLESGMTETPAGAVRAVTGTLTAAYNHEDEDKLEISKKIQALFLNDRRSDALALAAANGLSSAFEAGAIVSRAARGATGEIALSCYAFGDVAITAAPFEMFCQTETRLRERSPFGFTLTCGYSNGSEGYMPAAECFPNKGYEVVTCKYVQGTAEAISDRQLELLNDLC
ncbi:MAG: neutral/alkaline non-lysosomal ceramidase N-terminal domain-containing protein, partial [Clostridia bacterium]|nr:neutral/alkaline non-lysosomal ceramidase N-terminal domain-containing protein [Clostridia bacterium]